jgi:hypothetical protein
MPSFADLGTNVSPSVYSAENPFAAYIAVAAIAVATLKVGHRGGVLGASCSPLYSPQLCRACSVALPGMLATILSSSYMVRIHYA